MSDPPEDTRRRSFLKRSALLAGASLMAPATVFASAETVVQKRARRHNGSATPQSSQRSSGSAAAVNAASIHPNLVLVADVVLPKASLGEDDMAQALARFRTWLDGFEPVAELDHPYLSTDEISYGPPDPRPLWLAQLEALDLEAQRRHMVDFSELDQPKRTEMIERAIDEASSDRDTLPSAERAAHIGLALASWYFGSTQANDLCYGARIGRYECRGMGRVSLKPRPLPNSTGEAAESREGDR